MSTSRALETDQLASVGTNDARLLSRRAVVRTGVTAAWSVPLIQVVGAAPALAVSGSKVEVVGGQAVWDGNYINVTVPVRNGGSESIETLTITLTFSLGLSPEPNSGPNGRWSAARSVSGGRVTITYVTTQAKLPPGVTTLVMQVKDRDHKNAVGSVDVAVIAPTGSFGTSYTVKPDSANGGKG
jgi:hypothetical protein